MSVSLDINALRERFTDQWATVRPTVPVVYENQPATDRPTTVFVRFAVRPGAVERAAFVIGPTRHVQIGRVFVQVCLPRGEGTGLADEIADDVAAIFRLWKSADHAVRCLSESRSTIPASDGDPWHIVTVSISYESSRNY